MAAVSAIVGLIQRGLLSALRGRVADGISIRTIGVVRMPGRIQLRCKLSTTRPELSDKPLLVDRSSSPIEIVNTWCEQRDEVIRPSGGRLLSYRAPKVGWVSAELVFEINWYTHATQPRLLILPEFLPTFIDSTKPVARKLPILEVTQGDSSESVQVAGLFDSEVENSGNTRLLQAVLPADGGFDLWGWIDGAPKGLLVSKTLISRLQAGHRRRITELVNAILQYLSRQMDMVVSMRLAMAARDDLAEVHWIPSGCVLTVAPESFGVSARGPNDFEVARRLASVWWGACCRLIGLHSKELQFAIQAMLAYSWTKDVGETDVIDGIIERYRSISRGTLIRDYWADLQGFVKPALAAKWALQLFDLANGSTEVLLALRTFLKAKYGQYAETKELIDTIRRAGVELTVQ